MTGIVSPDNESRDRTGNVSGFEIRRKRPHQPEEDTNIPAKDPTLGPASE